MEIRYLRHNQINKQKWDALLDHSPQSLIYAYSWYLDSMSPNWDALIGGDYEAIFPLPWNKKLFGIKRVLKPRLCQQLGLFSLENEVAVSLLEDFLKSIPDHFKAIDINLNEQNPCPQKNQWISKKRVNMLLPLLPSYSELYSHYSEHHKRNLKKSIHANLVPVNNMTPDHFINSFLEQNKDKIKAFSNDQKKNLSQLINNSIESKAGIIRALSDEKGKLQSAVFLQNSKDRLYYLLPFSTEEGRRSAAMYSLMDQIFKEYAGSNKIFDFEGSSLPGVAKFYKGFGASETNYYQIIKNQLPFWITWILKISGR